MSKQIQQRNEFRAQILNRELGKMTDSIKSIIETSSVSSEKKSEDVSLEKNMREGLEMQINVLQLMNSTQVLLNLVNELKEAYILGDYVRHDQVVTERRDQLNFEIENAKIIKKELMGRVYGQSIEDRIIEE